MEHLEEKRVNNGMKIPYVRQPVRHVALRMILLSGLLGALAMPASANSSRQLSFYHTHTGERLTVTYWQNGEYLDSALAEISHFLRDFRTGDAFDMDPALLDTLHLVYQRTGSRGHFEVISAYRSPKTNEMLRSRSGGVAKKSQRRQAQPAHAWQGDRRPADGHPHQQAAQGRLRAAAWGHRLLRSFKFRAPRHRPVPNLVASAAYRTGTMLGAASSAARSSCTTSACS